MTEDQRPPSIKDLESRIRKARNAQMAADFEHPQPSPVGQALRLGVEMASSLFVGAAIGWLFDRWLDTKPWFLLVFLLLGCAGGLLNLYRTGKRLSVPAGKNERNEGDND